ncbi:MAG TPA: gas vesicle protein K [Vicinamibacterales bacterium]|nr:gas vesicle protein K [Vicinamibacterales bacterium]
MALKRSPRSPRRRAKRRATKVRQQGRRVAPGVIAIHEVESLRAELDRLAQSPPPRWNADPDEVRKSVLKLVLTLVEFIRQILERQAIRRMEANTLTAEETESVGLALMRLEETIRDLAEKFGLQPEELNLDLGPIGKLV